MLVISFGYQRTDDTASPISDTPLHSFGDLALSYYDTTNNRSIINAYFDENNTVVNGKCSAVLTNAKESDNNISIKWSITLISILIFDCCNLIFSCFLTYKHYQILSRKYKW